MLHRHVVPLVAKHGYFGDIMEDGVELSHQVMGSLHQRLAGLKVWSRKAMSISQYTKIKSNPKVIEASKKVQAASKRNFSAESRSKRKKVDEKAARTTRRKTQLQEESKRNDEPIDYKGKYMKGLNDHM